jgi:hypothetical protein
LGSPDEEEEGEKEGRKMIEVVFIRQTFLRVT